jgi:hypothetical protein
VLTRLRGDDGWASVELAIITPALVFLVAVFVSLIGVATQRVNMVATLRDVAIAVSRSEDITTIAAGARAELPGFQDVQIRLSDSVEDRGWRTVTVTAHHPLPPPLSFLKLSWSESMRVLRDD